ncbi:TRAP-type mannitol/chloroaromatic compound transport system permease small subunit [Massilia violacea]|uniref:TRAP transporter small permease protein n=2 Tax=Pseudoduganella violacea TaxID=1715466 RepID=A0A7W5FVA6_9BURK|nr:TRAP-type mannitol/chloroaromatic compound transport system permease small subunit [Pseudoduganella violacea]
MFMPVSRAIDQLNDKIAAAVSWALLLAVIICTGNALIRYAFNASSNAWLEIQWYLFAAVFMLASSHTLRRDEHVRIDVIVGRFSKRTQVWIDLLGFLLFLMPISLVILYYGVPFALESLRSGEMSSNAGGLIVWPAKILVPLGFILMVLQGLSEIIKRIAFLNGKLDASAFSKQVATPEEEIEAIKAANKMN